MPDASHSSPAAAAGSARTSRARSRATAGTVVVAARSRDADRRGRRRDRRPRARARRRLDRESVERAFAEVGDVDLLVDNAGITACRRPRGRSIDDWWRVFEVNVLGALPLLPRGDPGHDRARRRADRRTSRSGAAYLPGSDANSAYSASQGGGAPLRRDAASELDGTASRVFSISPGLVRTDDDVVRFPGRRAVDAAGARARRSSASSRPAATTRSPAATSTPSTTTSTTCSRASTRCASSDLNAIRLRR